MIEHVSSAAGIDVILRHLRRFLDIPLVSHSLLFHSRWLGVMLDFVQKLIELLKLQPVTRFEVFLFAIHVLIEDSFLGWIYSLVSCFRHWIESMEPVKDVFFTCHHLFLRRVNLLTCLIFKYFNLIWVEDYRLSFHCKLWSSLLKCHESPFCKESLRLTLFSCLRYTESLSFGLPPIQCYLCNLHYFLPNKEFFSIIECFLNSPLLCQRILSECSQGYHCNSQCLIISFLVISIGHSSNLLFSPNIIIKKSDYSLFKHFTVEFGNNISVMDL